MSTEKSTGKGKGTASSGPSDALEAKHVPAYTLYPVKYFGEDPKGARFLGYTTSIEDYATCKTLMMAPYAPLHFNTKGELQAVKAAIAQRNEIAFRRFGFYPNAALPPKAGVYWITPTGVVDKTGSKNEETVLTLGCTSIMLHYRSPI
jgi:hypothetical protein